jgi:hypothetical protein
LVRWLLQVSDTTNWGQWAVLEHAEAFLKGILHVLDGKGHFLTEYPSLPFTLCHHHCYFIVEFFQTQTRDQKFTTPSPQDPVNRHANLVRGQGCFSESVGSPQGDLAEALLG